MTIYNETVSGGVKTSGYCDWERGTLKFCGFEAGKGALDWGGFVEGGGTGSTNTVIDSTQGPIHTGNYSYKSPGYSYYPDLYFMEESQNIDGFIFANTSSTFVQSLYTRCYIYLNDYPSSNNGTESRPLFEAYIEDVPPVTIGAIGSPALSVQLWNDGTLRINEKWPGLGFPYGDGGNASGGTPLPIGQWILLEIRQVFIQSHTKVVMQIRVNGNLELTFTSDGTTYDYTSASFSRVYFGTINSLGYTGSTFFLDDILIRQHGWIGEGYCTIRKADTPADAYEWSVPPSYPLFQDVLGDLPDMGTDTTSITGDLYDQACFLTAGDVLPSSLNAAKSFVVGEGENYVPIEVIQSCTSGAAVTGSWSNINSINASDDTRAICSITTASFPEARFTNCSFSLPNDGSVGVRSIEVKIEASQTGSSAVKDYGIFLVYQGNIISQGLSQNTQLPTTDTLRTYGTGNLIPIWAPTTFISPTVVNDSTFGVLVKYQATNSAIGTLRIDQIQIKVYYAQSPQIRVYVRKGSPTNTSVPETDQYTDYYTSYHVFEKIVDRNPDHSALNSPTGDSSTDMKPGMQMSFQGSYTNLRVYNVFLMVDAIGGIVKGFGGVRVGGAARFSYNERGSSGVIAGGMAQWNLNGSSQTGGGIIASGSAHFVYNERGSGGCVTGGINHWAKGTLAVTGFEVGFSDNIVNGQIVTNVAHGGTRSLFVNVSGSQIAYSKFNDYGNSFVLTRFGLNIAYSRFYVRIAQRPATEQVFYTGNAGLSYTDEIKTFSTIPSTDHPEGYRCEIQVLNPSLTFTFNWNEEAADLQFLLETLPQIGSGNITVNRTGNAIVGYVYTLHFTGTLSQTSIGDPFFFLTTYRTIGSAGFIPSQQLLTIAVTQQGRQVNNKGAARLRLTNNGSIALYDENTFLTIGTKQLLNDFWYRIEVRHQLSGSSCRTTVRVDGVQDIDYTETLPAVTFGWSEFRLGKDSAFGVTTDAIKIYFDDVLIRTSTWADAGYTSIFTVDGAGSYSQGWSGSYLDVDDATVDNDTTVISSSVASLSSYHTNISNILGDVNATKAIAVAKTTSAFSPTILVQTYEGSSLVSSQPHILDSTYEGLTVINDAPKSNKVGWDTNTLDNYEIGVRSQTTINVTVTALYVEIDQTGSPAFSSIGTGGARAAGRAKVGKVYYQTSSGGIKVSGRTLPVGIAIPSGGVVIGGTAIAEHRLNLVSVGGGQRPGGRAAFNKTIPITGSSGGQLGGAAFTAITLFVANGGASLGGSHSLVQIFTPRHSAGALLSGIGRKSVVRSFTGSSGIGAGGSARVTTAIHAAGTVNLAGNASYLTTFTSRGTSGARPSGSASVSKITSPSPTSGAKLGGLLVTGNIYIESSLSGVIAAGSGIELKNFDYTGSGGVEVSGTISFSTYTPIHGGIRVSGTAVVEYELNLEREFTWNIGEGIYEWYRIEGHCIPELCPPLSSDDSCQWSSVTSVMARSVEEAVRKLADRGWTWPIKSIKKFTKPVFKSDDPDPTNTCNSLLTIMTDVDLPEDLQPLFVTEDLTSSDDIDSVLT